MFTRITSGLALGTVAVSAWLLASAWQQGYPSAQPGPNLIGEKLFAQWENTYGVDVSNDTVQIRLGHIKGLSKRFTSAAGEATVRFGMGEVAINVRGLEAPAPDASHEVWLVDHSENNSVALDEDDSILKLGTLPPSGEMRVQVGASRLARFNVEMVAVMRVGADAQPQLVIAGFQSISFKTLRKTKLAQERPGADWYVARVESTISVQANIDQGRTIFFGETFAGNGRTCATCHREENSFVINPPFIKNLAQTNPTDPLFITKNPQTGVVNPNLPDGLFEDSTRMLKFGHILENQDGFDNVCEFPDTNDGSACITVKEISCNAAGCTHPKSKSTRRDTPTVINTLLTEPIGFGGEFDLQGLTAGAITQHFPKTLNRRTSGINPDFRLPTVQELDDLEAFQQSVLLPSNITDPGFDPFALAKTDAEKRGAILFQAGVNGKPVIPRTRAGKCTACHVGPTLAGAANFDTGTRVPLLEFGFPRNMHVDDGGTNVCGSDAGLNTTNSCSLGSFNVPALIGIARTAPFFHNGRASTLEAAVLFYINLQFRTSSAAQFIRVVHGDGTTDTDIQLRQPEDINDVAAFLRALVPPTP